MMGEKRGRGRVMVVVVVVVMEGKETRGARRSK